MAVPGLHRRTGFSLIAATLWFRCLGFSSCWLLLLQRTGSRVLGLHICGSPALEHRLHQLCCMGLVEASSMAQWVKNPGEMQVPSLGQKELLKEEMATNSSIPI